MCILHHRVARVRGLVLSSTRLMIHYRVVRTRILMVFQTCPKIFCLASRRPTTCIGSLLRPWCLLLALANLSAVRIRVAASCGRPLFGRTHSDSGPSRCGHSVFDHCQYGGSRPKKTLLLHNVPSFDKLCLQCPGESSDHQHLPLGPPSAVFAMPLPRKQLILYPCVERWRSFCCANSPRKATGPRPVALQILCSICIMLLRFLLVPSLGARGCRLWFPEFKTIVSVDSNHDFLPRGTRLEASLPLPVDATCDQAVSLLPAGSRVLQRLHLGTDESTVRLETSKTGTHPFLESPSETTTRCCREACCCLPL